MAENNHNYAIILAGGQGTRFWPLSRSLEPKQFLTLFTNKSLFQDTISRIKTVIDYKNIFIVTSQLYFPAIYNYTSEFKIPKSNILFEPEGKNTAPSIAVASRLISLVDPEAKIVVLPSDHLIKNKKRFKYLLKHAFSLSEFRKNLIIFGIIPDFASTEYGYIKVGSRVKSQESKTSSFVVKRFLEKPNIQRAKRFYKNKHYFWNSGIFVGQVSVFLAEIKIHTPLLYRLCLKIQESGDINKIWRKVRSISFDYGILEKTKNILMLPALNLGWSDLGTWASLDKISPKDKFTNTIRADVINLGSKNISVFGKKRLIACLGLENLIIVDTPDALLVTHKNVSEKVKAVVEELKKYKRQEFYTHKTVKRPWGRYTVLDSGVGFKIKLVEVLPKKTLSLQKHSRRSEHWVVVQGRAKITKGKHVSYIDANESTFIPIGRIHRLENPTSNPLKIVEVQSGDYLEEDDIVRLKDDFQRI